MKRTKVLIVGAFPAVHSSIVGGIVTTCRLLISSDFRNQFELTLIDSTQRSNPPPRLIIRLFFAMRRTFGYLIALVREKPDAVLLFTAVGASVVEKGAMAWMARIKKRPVLLFPRGAALIDKARDGSWQSRLLVSAMKGATHFLCQGPTWQDFAIKDLGYSEHNAPIVYNWSATVDLLKIGAARQLCADQIGLKILFLGWLEEEKGIFELLEACRRLINKRSFVLSIAGRGNAEKRAMDLVAEYRMDSCVTFEGWARYERKINLLKSADILVLPSWAEGFPNAIVEAMAAKVAVIVSAVGNVPDMLEHRRQAMIVPPKNVDALTNVLEELILNAYLRTTVAERGFAYARENFSTQKGVQRLADIIIAAVENCKVAR